MARSKKPRKPRNTRKESRLVVERHAKNMFVAWSRGMKSNEVFNTEGNPSTKRPPALLAAFSHAQFRWSSLCIVLCRDQQGVEYTKEAFVTSNDYYNYEDLSRTLNKVHQELLKGCNSEHVLNVAWIASPVGKEPSRKTIMNVLANLNAWQFNAKWEADKWHNENNPTNPGTNDDKIDPTNQGNLNSANH